MDLCLSAPTRTPLPILGWGTCGPYDHRRTDKPGRCARGQEDCIATDAWPLLMTDKVERSVEGEPRAIVLVSTEAGGALTATGTFGARPPLCYRAGSDEENSGWVPCRLSCRYVGVTLGLLLWWDSALVPEGWDHARRVWSESATAAATLAEVDPGGWVLADRAADDSWPEAACVLILARALERAGLCRVVLLDLVDYALVERAP